jgi:hypothetical protein
MCSFHNFVIAFTIIIRAVSPTAMTDIAPMVTTGATDFGAISDNRGVVLGDAFELTIIKEPGKLTRVRHVKWEVELGNVFIS